MKTTTTPEVKNLTTVLGEWNARLETLALPCKTISDAPSWLQLGYDLIRRCEHDHKVLKGYAERLAINPSDAFRWENDRALQAAESIEVHGRMLLTITSDAFEALTEPEKIERIAMRAHETARDLLQARGGLSMGVEQTAARFVAMREQLTAVRKYPDIKEVINRESITDLLPMF